MKVNEIMIGDWVNVLPISHKVKAHYDKVESIHKEYTGQLYIEGGYHNREHIGNDWFDWSVGIDNIAPIPLTPEILTKIGFEGRNYCYLKIDDFSYLEYYSFEHRLRRIYNGVDEWENHTVVRDIVFQCHCTYVHELQHAFKLCGIEKEIEL